MKENYVSAEMEVILFRVEDVITTSYTEDGAYDPDGWT
jgi:hypothetical protein